MTESARSARLPFDQGKSRPLHFFIDGDPMTTDLRLYLAARCIENDLIGLS
jgi:hypothetical protein